MPNISIKVLAEKILKDRNLTPQVWKVKKIKTKPAKNNQLIK